MNGPRKSDSPIVPVKSPNKAGQPAAEEAEGRGLAKGNLPQQNAPPDSVPAGCAQCAGAGASGSKESSSALRWRYYPRQEPDAVMPHVRIRGGGHGQP